MTDYQIKEHKNLYEFIHWKMCYNFFLKLKTVLGNWNEKEEKS